MANINFVIRTKFEIQFLKFEDILKYCYDVNEFWCERRRGGGGVKEKQTNKKRDARGVTLFTNAFCI